MIMTDLIRQMTREHMEKLETSQHKVSKALGVNRLSITRLFSSSGSVPSLWARMLEHLGLTLVVIPNDKLNDVKELLNEKK